MGETVREVMETRFFTLKPANTIAEAVRLFQQASAGGPRVYGLMVTDDAGTLAGMLSMYDIFLLIRPKHTHIWGEMSDLELDGLLDTACRRVQGVLVGDIMTTDLITVTPDTHLMLVIDLMLKKHVRRIPVVEQDRVVGIVYISRVFYHLLDRLTETV